MIRQHKYNIPLPSNKYNPLSWIAEGAIIGDNCWIGSDVVISKNVVIKDNVSIASGAKIYDHDTSWNRATEGRIPVTYNTVTIRDNTQIGSNSIIIAATKDITIGSNCIMGALSLINKSFPSNKVIAGIPAVIVGSVYDKIKEEDNK